VPDFRLKSIFNQSCLWFLTRALFWTGFKTLLNTTSPSIFFNATDISFDCLSIFTSPKNCNPAYGDRLACPAGGAIVKTTSGPLPCLMIAMSQPVWPAYEYYLLRGSWFRFENDRFEYVRFEDFRFQNIMIENIRPGWLRTNRFLNESVSSAVTPLLSPA